MHGNHKSGAHPTRMRILGGQESVSTLERAVHPVDQHTHRQEAAGFDDVAIRTTLEAETVVVAWQAFPYRAPR